MASTEKASLNELKQLLQKGHFAQAEKQCLQGLNEFADADHKQQLNYFLAIAQRYQLKHEQALQTIEAILQQFPDDARSWQEKGYNMLALKDTERAIAAFKQASQLNPGLIACWQNLAVLYQQTGQLQESGLAQGQFEYLRQLPPPLSGARELMYEGKLHQAEQICRQFLQQHKHHIEAMCLLAEVGTRLKIYDDAEFLLESCVELAPEHQRSRVEYLHMLIRLGKFQQARKQAEWLLEKQPGNPAYLMAMASVQVGLGEVSSGIDYYRQVLQEDEQRSGVWVQLGHAYKALGEYPKAVDAYQKACQLKPEYGDAYWSLANTKTYRFTDVQIAQMQTLEQTPGLNVDDRIHLCFATGKALEDQQQYQQAFEYYQRGNQLKHQQTGYDITLTEAQIEQQMRYCTPELMAQRQDVGSDSDEPIFILGLPRAGSTLLEQILASHSLVDGTRELHNIMALAMRLRGRVAEGQERYPRNLADIEPQYFKRFGEQYLQDTRVFRQNGRYFIDKMPNNFMHIGLIKMIFPKAKIIDARRQAMACCFSGYKQLFGEGQEFSYDLDAIGRYYRAYEKLMAHWDRVFPGQILRVQHEQLVEDPEGQIRRLLDYCELPFEQGCIDFHQTKRTIQTPSAEQVRQPIYKSAVEQWKHFEPWLAPLKEALQG